MCCFSREVEFVRNTRIFARSEDSIRQLIVYQMAFKAQQDLAIILPLPVRQGSGEDAVKFIDLKEYTNFFDDLNSDFPRPSSSGCALGCSRTDEGIAPLLQVQEVGNYEASFVPTLADFIRLDERFRLANDIWKKLPGYENYGFAVFQLKAGEHESHPLAFSFPRRRVGSLFFPTVHIHDGEVHAKAAFDHTLYCQPSASAKLDLRNWLESNSLAGSFMNVIKAKTVIDKSQHCYRLTMRGNLNNSDVYIHTA